MGHRNQRANISRLNANAEHKPASLFPLFYWLVEDGEVKTVLCVPDSASLKELNTLQQSAQAQGTTIELRKATLKDWLDTHR